MSRFLVSASEYGGIQKQLGGLISVVGVGTTTTSSLDAYEERVNEIKHQEINPRDEKMISYLNQINVNIKETSVGLSSVGIWTGSVKIYSTSSAASNALNIFGDARRSEEDRVFSVIVSAASSGSSTGLTTTGSVSIGATEYIDIPVGADVEQYYYSGSNRVVSASGVVGVNTGNILIIRDVTGTFNTTRTVAITTTGGASKDFTFPVEVGFVGVTSIRTDLIRVKMYDSYEPSYNTSVSSPKSSSTEVTLTSSNVGLGYSQFYYQNGYNDGDEPFYYSNTIIGPTISNESVFPRVQSPEMSTLAYTTDNTSNNNQITSLVSGISTYRVGIPTYLAASCTIKEYKTEFQDIVWLFKKGGALTGGSKNRYQSYYDAMDQGDPEMDVNVPPLPPVTDDPVDDDEINV